MGSAAEGAIGSARRERDASGPPSRAQGSSSAPTRAAEAWGCPTQLPSHLLSTQLPTQREAAVRALTEPWAS